MSIKSLGLKAALCLAAFPLIAAAQGPDADTNGDEIISRMELEAAAASKFKRADTNSDNFLDDNERLMLMKKRDRKKGMKRAEKREAMRATLLGEYDRNGDGRLTDAEEMAFLASGEPKAGERRFEKRARMERYNRMDTDLDGLVDMDEYLVTTNKMFDVMDTNKDGKLSKSESGYLVGWLRAN